MPSDALPAALTQRSAPAEIKSALHAHLRLIVDKPITTRMLLELEQAASLASKLLIVSGDPRAMNLGRQRGAMGMPYEGAEVIGPADLEVSPIAPGGFGGPLAPAAFGMPENFGSEALRNLVADMQKPKIRDLLDALENAEGLARRCSDDDKEYYKRLVMRLRAQVDALTGEDLPTIGEIDAEFEDDKVNSERKPYEPPRVESRNLSPKKES